LKNGHEKKKCKRGGGRRGPQRGAPNIQKRKMHQKTGGVGWGGGLNHGKKTGIVFPWGENGWYRKQRGNGKNTEKKKKGRMTVPPKKVRNWGYQGTDGKGRTKKLNQVLLGSQEKKLPRKGRGQGGLPQKRADENREK